MERINSSPNNIESLKRKNAWRIYKATGKWPKEKFISWAWKLHKATKGEYGQYE